MRAIDSILESSGPAARATIKFRLSSFQAWGAGDVEEAERTCAEAVELFAQAGDRLGTLLARNELGWMQALKGDLAGHEAMAMQVLEDAQAADERFAVIQALGALGIEAFWRGRFDDAVAYLTRSASLAREDG